MNEIIDAIIDYFGEGLDEDVTTLRDSLTGGLHAHLAPHDSRNPFGTVATDTPEVDEHVMNASTDSQPSDPQMYGTVAVKFSIFTTVTGPDGYNQIKGLMDNLDKAYRNRLLTLTTQRIVYALLERRHIFPDPDGGWTGIRWIRYHFGNL